MFRIPQGSLLPHRFPDPSPPDSNAVAFVQGRENGLFHGSAPSQPQVILVQGVFDPHLGSSSLGLLPKDWNTREDLEEVLVAKLEASSLPKPLRPRPSGTRVSLKAHAGHWNWPTQRPERVP